MIQKLQMALWNCRLSLTVWWRQNEIIYLFASATPSSMWCLSSQRYVPIYTMPQGSLIHSVAVRVKSDCNTKWVVLSVHILRQMWTWWQRFALLSTVIESIKLCWDEYYWALEQCVGSTSVLQGSYGCECALSSWLLFSVSLLLTGYFFLQLVACWMGKEAGVSLNSFIRSVLRNIFLISQIIWAVVGCLSTNMADWSCCLLGNSLS
jgi:hypothetical protein